MAEEFKRIDYTTKDYDGYREDMIEQIPSKLPEWTDTSDNDPGIVILELLASQLEKISYYNDRVANEVFLPTATQRKSVIANAKMIDYELAWFKSARHYQVFEFEPQEEDIIIPKGTQIGTIGTETEPSIIFETLEDLVIPAGLTGAEKDAEGKYVHTVETEQGQTIVGEILGDVINQEENMQFKLQYTPVLKESIAISVDGPNGRYNWEIVDDFIGSSQTDFHCKIEMNEYDEVIVTFGNGTSGAIPALGSTVYADYKVGGGIDGNVGVNTVVEIYESFPGFVSTFNPYEQHVKGEDKESIEQAKINAPASLRRMDRYVTLPDFEEGIKLDVEGISKVKALGVDGVVQLYVVPTEGDYITEEKRNELIENIDSKIIMFTEYAINNPTYHLIDITVNLIIFENYNAEVVRYSARNVLEDMFLPENVSFGGNFTIGSIFFNLMGVEGVQNAIITTPTADIPIGETSIPKKGNITVLINGK